MKSDPEKTEKDFKETMLSSPKYIKEIKGITAFPLARLNLHKFFKSVIVIFINIKFMCSISKILLLYRL